MLNATQSANNTSPFIPLGPVKTDAEDILSALQNMLTHPEQVDLLTLRLHIHGALANHSHNPDLILITAYAYLLNGEGETALDYLKNYPQNLNFLPETQFLDVLLQRFLAQAPPLTSPKTWLPSTPEEAKAFHLETEIYLFDAMYQALKSLKHIKHHSLGSQYFKIEATLKQLEKVQIEIQLRQTEIERKCLPNDLNWKRTLLGAIILRFRQLHLALKYRFQLEQEMQDCASRILFIMRKLNGFEDKSLQLAHFLTICKNGAELANKLDFISKHGYANPRIENAFETVTLRIKEFEALLTNLAQQKIA